MQLNTSPNITVSCQASPFVFEL